MAHCVVVWVPRSSTMKIAGWPSSRRRLPMAAARCVLPVPNDPSSTTQPSGRSANSRARSYACCWCSCGRKAVNVLSRKACKLLCSSSTRIFLSSSSLALHAQGTVWPKRGSSRSTSSRSQPAPPHVGQLRLDEVAVFAPAVAVGVVILLRTSRIDSMVPALGLPAAQNPTHVAPVALIVLHCLAHGVLDPRCWILQLGRAQLVGNKRRQRADVLLVERKDVGPLHADHLDLVDGQHLLDGPATSLDMAQRLTAGGRVEEVPALPRPAHLAHAQGEQGAARHGPLQTFAQVVLCGARALHGLERAQQLPVGLQLRPGDRLG